MNDFMFSKSKINTFLQCPRQFKYKYIDELEDEPNEYMELGLIVHDLAETIGKDIQASLVDTDEIATIVYNMKFDTDFDLEPHFMSLACFFIDILDNGYKIFSVEEKISNPDSHFRGIIDIVLENQDGDLIVFDYKTSKKTKPITNYRLELCIYKHLLEYKYPNKKVIAAGIFFTHNNDYRVVNFTDTQKRGAYITTEDYNFVMSLPKKLLSVMENNVYLPKRQFICKFCYFADRCTKEGGF